jgi:sulfite oxidase
LVQIGPNPQRLDPTHYAAELRRFLLIAPPVMMCPRALAPTPLVVHQNDPFNAETPAERLTERFLTPTGLGARSIKWLDDVVVRDTPSANHFYASSYRLSPASGSSEPFALAEIPLNAVICRPRALQARAGDIVDMEGYAIGTGGRAVERVEVSADDARTWHRAEISSSREAWAWRFWTVRIETSPRDRELMVRAWDGTAACQPADAAAAWNARGYVNNAWHRVPLDIGVGRKPAR